VTDLAFKARYLLLSLVVLVLDQWTKWLVEVHLPRGVSQPVIGGFFNLVHVQNSGVAFGLFAEQGAARSWMLALLGLVALSAVAVYFWITPRGDLLLLTALALVAGGAVGNLIDRIAAGGVTDFLDVYVGSYHWPAFNVADSAITVGIGLMIFDAVLPGRRRRAAAAGTPRSSRAAARAAGEPSA
jgi:signal peptidase II